MAPEIIPARAHDIMHPKSEFLYSATDIIYKLLRVLGTEVCAFRRNHQVAFRLVEYARDLYDAINARIHLVDINNSWEDYEIYTQAIDPLEEVLLNIIPTTFNEPELDHIRAGSWAEYVTITGQWRDNRLAIRNCFRDMRTNPRFQALIGTLMDDGEDIYNACTLDDLSYLEYLLRIIGENIQPIADAKVKDYVEKVVDGLAKTGEVQRKKSGKFLHVMEELNVLPIQCAQIASRMVVMMVNESVPEDIRNHLMSDTSLWGALALLVIDVYSFMVSLLATSSSDSSLTRTDISVTIAEFTARYDEVVKMADKLPVSLAIEIPQAYSRLLPLVGKIDRRYHAQSLLLVALCRQATSKFGTKKCISSRDALERALNQTIAALEAAGQDPESGKGNLVNGRSAHEVQKGSDHTNGKKITQDGTNECASLYEQSADELTTCFKAMEISHDVDHREKLKQAQSKDSARVTAVNERLAKYVHPSSVEVAVDVYENTQNGRKVASLIFASIPSTARLEYIKHLVVNQLEDRVSAQTGHFERAGVSHDQLASLPLDLEVKGVINDKNLVVFVVHQSN